MWQFLGPFEIAFSLTLLVLLIGPVVLFLVGPWRDRRDEILGCLSGQSALLYFSSMYPAGLPGLTSGEHVHPSSSEQAERELRRLYLREFGRHRYVVPLVLLAIVSLLLLLWVGYTLAGALGLRPGERGRLPWLAVSAVAGAYVWVVDDLIRRWRSRDYSPAVAWAAALRLVLATPLGFAVGALLQDALALPVAFLLGAFPTTTVTLLAKRLLHRKTELGDTAPTEKKQLEQLQGVSPAIAERFEDEGVATIVQLAYADPVDLTMRCSSYTFSFVVDCASQALAWLYLEDKLPALRKLSLRGAQEISTLVDDLDQRRGPSASAAAILDKCASVVEVPADALAETFRQIAGDPYTRFICSAWCAEDDGGGQSAAALPAEIEA